MYNELKSSQKVAKRGGATQKAFVKPLGKTFDISYAESQVLIQNPEDKAFLHA